MEDNKNYIENIIGLYRDSLISKDNNKKDLLDRAIECTKELFSCYEVTSYSKKITNVLFLDFIRTFKNQNEKHFSLTAELVFRDINNLLYTNTKQTNSPMGFSVYLSADKTFKKVDKDSYIFSSTKTTYEPQAIDLEIIELINKLTLKGYITLLLVLFGLKEKEPVNTFII